MEMLSVSSTIMSLADKLIGIYKSSKKDINVNENNEEIANLFVDAEVVFNNYRRIFTELKNRVELGETPVSLIRWLEGERDAALSIRHKIMAISELRGKRVDEVDPRSAFYGGIIDLMCLESTFSSRGHLTAVSDVNGRPHTLLDVLNRLRVVQENGYYFDQKSFFMKIDEHNHLLLCVWDQIVRSYAKIIEY